MAKARSRTAARKVKDKWKAKKWYNVLAPESFDNVTVAETLAENESTLIKRVTEVSLQDITNDFRKSHIKLFFEIYEIDGSNAKTRFIGHTLTSDYLRRMIRRKRSKVDGIYDVITRDGARVRIKPFATTDRRIQNSQKRVIRDMMKKTIGKQATTSTLSGFIKYIIDGKMGSEIYKSCKKIYPVKRVEIYKTHVISQPTIIIEEPKKPEPEEKPVEDKETTTEKQSEEQMEEEIIESKEEPIDEPADEPAESIDESEEPADEEIKEEPVEEELIEEEIDESIKEEQEEIEEEKKPVEEEMNQEEPSSEDETSTDEESEESSEEKKKE